MAFNLPEIAPYLEEHRNPKGPGDARPTALKVIHDQNAAGSLGGLTVLVTGGTSGLGKETVRALHATGAKVWMTSLPSIDGKAIASEIEQQNADDPYLKQSSAAFQPIEVIELDLTSFKSIKAAAADFLSRSKGKLNILDCNAGVMNPPIETTMEGYEAHIGINFVGHFCLFHLLGPAMVKAAQESPGFASRVVVVSSIAHRSGAIDSSTFKQGPREPYGNTPSFEYGRSKLALLWFALALERRFSNQGIHALAASPGACVTELIAHLDPAEFGDKLGLNDEGNLALSRSPEQGAANMTWAAIARELEGLGGLYIDDVRVGVKHEEGYGFAAGYGPNAYDFEAAEQLWADMSKMVKEDGMDF